MLSIPSRTSPLGICLPPHLYTKDGSNVLAGLRLSFVRACGEMSVSETSNPTCRIVRATWSLLVLLTLLANSAAAATIAISVASHPDAIEIAGSAQLDADAETAWRVLTDYERYIDFIPDLHGSRVVARNGATVTVEQTGNVILWGLHMPLDVTFEITEIAPTSLVSRVVAGDLRSLNSRYVLTPVGTGVRLEYSGKLDSGFVLLDALETLAVKQNVPRPL